MKVPSSFILMVGDDGALLAPPATGRAEPLFTEGHDDEQARAVLDALKAYPDVPVLLLADTLAQELRHETLPRLSFFDRRKLLARRMKNYFPETGRGQLSAALPLKKNNALFVCLHDGGPVSIWTKRLESLPNAFLGVALLPLEGAGLFKILSPEAKRGWGMLLSLHRTGGFRQIVTHDGAPIFARLTPPLPPTSKPSYVVSMLTLDIQATLDYLARHGLSEDAPMRLTAILPAYLHEALGTLQAPIEPAEMYSPRQAGKKLGLSLLPETEDPTSDIVFAGWVASTRRARVLLLPDEKKRADAVARVRRWGILLALILWGTAFFVCGIEGHGLYRLERERLKTGREIVSLEKEFDETRAKLGPATEPLGRLRQAAARQRLFSAPPVVPWALFGTLNENIKGEARVAHLEWRYDPLQAKSETLRVQLRLTQYVAPLAAPQVVVQQIDRMAQNLRSALSGYDVSVARYPFLVKSDETLFNDGHVRDSAAPLQAEILLQRGLP